MSNQILSGCFPSIRDSRCTHELYNTYQMMIRRCYDPDLTTYQHYGARGISVCDRWCGVDGFWSFVMDMGERPDGTTLDRIDPYGNYSEVNCRWADKTVQANNIRLGDSVKGVHWCNRDNCWISQITLSGKRAVIGRFNREDFEEAQAVYIEAKRQKIEGVPDDVILNEYVTSVRVGLKKTRMRRNKTSKYWGVSYKKSNMTWIAYTTEYIGVSRTEEGAKLLVDNWLEQNGHKT